MERLTAGEKVALIREAQDHLTDAIGLLMRAVGEDEGVRRTLIAHLEITAHRDHGWLARDINLDDLVDHVWEAAEEDGEEDGEEEDGE
jgi:hypothetical protein